MGVSYHVYVGPYITVYNPEKPATEEVHACGNPKCKRFEDPCSAKYCSDCGIEIKLIEVPTTERVDMWDILIEMDDSLSNACGEYKSKELEDYNILIPNKRADFAHHFSAYDTEVIQTSGATVQEDESAFLKQYKKEIEILQKKFGDKNVNVVWGVVAYAC
jgi:hypothetical protein